MTPAETVSRLEQQFGPKIKGKKLDALDPFVTVDAADLVEVCQFLHDALSGTRLVSVSR